MVELAAYMAIGSVAAMGFPVAIAGAIGHVIAGLAIDGLPAWSAGFVYLPALVGISITSLPVRS